MAKVRTIPRNGLILEALLDGNVLDTNDGTKATLTATNVPYENTNVGYQYQCGLFNGSSSKVTAPDSSALDLAGTSASWCSWFYMSTTGTEKIIFHKESGSGSIGGYQFFVDSTNVLGMRIRDSSNGNDNVLSTTSLSSGKWYFGAATYDGANVKIYLDGQLIKTQAATRSIGSTTLSLGIGSSAAGGNYFNGKLQTCRIYNRPLSEYEIQSIFIEGKKLLAGKSYNDLMNGCVAYYDMRGDANDVIGGYNGTVTGATLTTDRFGNANNAYSFNGSNQYISTGNVPISGAYTFSFPWTPSSNATGSSVKVPICRVNSAGTSTYVWFIQDHTTAGYQRAHVVSNGTNLYAAKATTSMTAGNTYNITCSYDGNSGGNIRIYVNGTLEATTAITGTIPATSYFNIGKGDSGGFYADCKMEEITVFNRLLSDSEIKALYVAAMREKIYPWYPNLPKSLQNGLVHAYSSNASGTTAYDWAGGTNGTLNNSPSITRRNLSKQTSFNGSTQYAYFNNSSANITTAFSLTAVFSIASSTTGGIVGNSTANSTTYPLYEIQVGNLGQTLYGVFFQNSTTSVSLTGPNLTYGNKYVVTIVKESSNSWKMYVNGGLYASSTTSLTQNATNKRGVVVGASGYNNVSSYSPTSVAHSLVHDRALSPIEAQMLHYSLYLK